MLSQPLLSFFSPQGKSSYSDSRRHINHLVSHIRRWADGVGALLVHTLSPSLIGLRSLGALIPQLLSRLPFAFLLHQFLIGLQASKSCWPCPIFSLDEVSKASTYSKPKWKFLVLSTGALRAEPITLMPKKFPRSVLLTEKLPR